MARPSRNIDQRLLAAGRALYPQAGCAGLAVRAVAERAGVQPGMLHYHFRTKDAFLRAVLQQLYEEMFASLSVSVAGDGDAIDRLRAALVALARFVRVHRRTLARLWMDALGGAAVAREFLQANAPRHVALLMGLIAQAERDGALRALPSVQRLVMLVGGVVLPMVFVGGLADAGGAPVALRLAFDREVMDDAAIAQRVELLIDTLRARPRVRRGHAAQEASA